MGVMYLHRVETDTYDIYRSLGGGIWSVVRIYRALAEAGLHWTEYLRRVFVPSNAILGNTAGWTWEPAENWTIPRSYNVTYAAELPAVVSGAQNIVFHATTQPASAESDWAAHALPTGCDHTTGLALLLFANRDFAANCIVQFKVGSDWVGATGGEWTRTAGVTGCIDFPKDGLAFTQWWHVDVPKGATDFRVLPWRGHASKWALYLLRAATPTAATPGDSGWQRSFGHEIKTKTGSDVFTVRIGSDWYGGHHGNEQDVTYTVAADGVDVTATLAVGDLLACQSARIVVTSTLKAGTGTSYGTLTKDFNIEPSRQYVDVNWEVEGSPTITTFYTGSETPSSSSSRWQDFTIGQYAGARVGDLTREIGADGKWVGGDVNAATPVNTAVLYGPRLRRTTTLSNLAGTTRLVTGTYNSPEAKIYFGSSATVGATVSYRLEHRTALIASSRPRAARLSLGLGLGL